VDGRNKSGHDDIALIWTRPMKSLRTFGVAIALQLALSGSFAHADDYPTRPVRLIVAFTVGGTADRTARLIAAKMESTLGGPVAVENKPGGMVQWRRNIWCKLSRTVTPCSSPRPAPSPSARRFVPI